MITLFIIVAIFFADGLLLFLLQLDNISASAVSYLL